jgi:hypothetical protein
LATTPEQVRPFPSFVACVIDDGPWLTTTFYSLFHRFFHNRSAELTIDASLSKFDLLQARFQLLVFSGLIFDAIQCWFYINTFSPYYSNHKQSTTITTKANPIFFSLTFSAAVFG